ncbi:MAG: YceD family protein [Candidatus Promineifilaceae bacterium]
MSKSRPSRLRFNFGFLLEAPNGTSREVELDYPTIQIADDMTLEPLQGSFRATRTSEGIYLSGRLTSRLLTECVRCLEEAIVPLTLDMDELFYYPPGEAPEESYVVGENGFIDLAPLVRELALLDTPIKPLCKPDCQGLCMECGANLNFEECGCEESHIDPRLDVLRNFLN